MTYVDLTTVDDIYQAQALNRALEEEGIRCIEANENTATILPYLQQGIQIRVKNTDYVKAKIISDKIAATRLLRCPNCQSNNVKYQGSESRALTILEILMKLVHFPVNHHLLIYRCSDCGTSFKTK